MTKIKTEMDEVIKELERKGIEPHSHISKDTKVWAMLWRMFYRLLELQKKDLSNGLISKNVIALKEKNG